MLDLTAHYSKLREQEKSEGRHADTALRRIVTAFQPGRAEGPAGEALANAFERMERAYAEDIDPETGEHIPRSMTRRLVEMAGEDMANHSGLPVGSAPLAMGYPEERTDERGFPLHVWHPGRQEYVPADWDDDGNLLSPDLSEWLQNSG